MFDIHSFNTKDEIHKARTYTIVVAFVRSLARTVKTQRRSHRRTQCYDMLSLCEWVSFKKHRWTGIATENCTAIFCELCRCESNVLILILYLYCINDFSNNFERKINENCLVFLFEWRLNDERESTCENSDSVASKHRKPRSFHWKSEQQCKYNKMISFFFLEFRLNCNHFFLQFVSTAHQCERQFGNISSG